MYNIQSMSQDETELTDNGRLFTNTNTLEVSWDTEGGGSVLGL